ncbi:MAG: magnesium transporter [Candidatus Sumerlaeia bacterium]|nr:magnesium transporter [Candidatus Sumerlaeia bacterium]
MLGKLLFPTIEELIRERDFRTLKDQLSQLPAADIADILEDLHESQLSVLFRLLPKDKATDVFEHLDIEQQQHLLNSLSKEKVKAILEEMSVDDRTQLLDEIPPEVGSQLLELLPQEDRELALSLLNYPENSVGRLITPDYVSLNEKMTVGEALDKIRRFGRDLETVYACYVIGTRRKLLGFISLRKLVTSPLDITIEDLYDKNFVYLRTDTPPEEAVEMLRRYDLIALPVVDSEGNMIGIVTFDDLMDVADEEFREDMDRMAAVMPGSTHTFLEEPTMSNVRRRAPWLVALLVVQAVAVTVLAYYDALLEQYIALAFFLPALVATGGNTGTQGATIVIRALATGEISSSDILQITWKSIKAGLVLCIVLGVAGFFLALGVNRDPVIGLCVAAGMGTVVLMSNLAGNLLPLVLKRVGLDPALMSGPFISTIVDVTGLLIYLQISTLILGSLGEG